MKINTALVVACALLAAGAAGEVLALTIPANGAPQVIVRVAGSSAMSKAFAAVVNAQLCQPGTNTAYWDDRAPLGTPGAEDGARYQGYYCSAKAGITGIAAGARLLILKRDQDGSLAGIGPVINKESIAFMKVDGTCTDRGAAIAYPNPRFLCSGLENAVPDAGLSDVESSLFATLGRFTQTVPGDVTEVKNTFGQGFGIGVSNSLYNALQAAQGLTVGATDAINQPKITRAQYASIVSTSGVYVNASFLTGVAGKLFNCRRPISSGTQVASDMFFLSNPCQRNAYPSFGQLSSRAAGNFGANLTIIEASSTADAISCLNNADPAVAGQEQAIGVVSLENVPSGGWKFIKLDGVSPNFYATDPDGAGALKRGDPDPSQRRNVILGHYLFAYEGTTLWRNDSVFAGASGPLQLIANGLGSPSLASFNGVYQVRKPPTTTNALFPDRVAKGTRSGNSCQNFQLFE